VKFDGWRVQIHKHGDNVRLCSRRGIDLVKRFLELRDHVVYLPDCIIDAELVACDTDGKPDFHAVTRKDPNLCLWRFDLLELRGEDLRRLPLIERKDKLRAILIGVDDDRLRYSEEFSDPVKLLTTVEKMGLEGIVSKRRNAPYRSAAQKNWVKVKCKAWLEANQDRWEHFQLG
jgi:bifunctional non-homologous end joining protein LigD